MIVLNYHGLSDDDPGAWSLPPDQFARHLEIVQPRLITPGQFIAQRGDPTFQTGQEVVLAFDDAFLSDYTQVFAHHMAAGRIAGFFCFVPVAFVGQPGRLKWEMIVEMHRYGVTVGSHGLDHVDLTKASAAILKTELTASKARLEDRLGCAVPDLAFPFGRFSSRVWRQALNCGYERMHTIQLGHHQGFAPFLVSRLCMRRDMSDAFLRAYLADPDSPRGKLWQLSKKFGFYEATMQVRFGPLAEAARIANAVRTAIFQRHLTHAP